MKTDCGPLFPDVGAMRVPTALCGLLVAAALLTGGCGSSDGTTPAEGMGAEMPDDSMDGGEADAVSGTSSSLATQPPTFEQFLAQTYREPASDVFIVDGDIPVVGETALREFYDRMIADSAGGGTGNLVVGTANGADVAVDARAKVRRELLREPRLRRAVRVGRAGDARRCPGVGERGGRSLPP